MSDSLKNLGFIPVSGSSGQGSKRIRISENEDTHPPKSRAAYAAQARKDAKRAAKAVVGLGDAPWLNSKTYSANLGLRLHQEICDFVRYLSPTAEEVAMRNDVVKRITAIAQERWPKVKVQVFGSYRTGLFLPTSDVDIVLLGGWKVPPLKTLATLLRQHGGAQRLQVIGKARVPIIKLVDEESKVAVDISFNRDMDETAIQMENLIQQFPSLRPLVLIVKVFLAQRGLNEPFTGGLGSYSVFLMVLSFLQLHIRPLTEPNLGVLLIEFFELYGKNFNYEDVQISVRGDGGYYVKEGEETWRNGYKVSLLSIENPEEPSMDVSRPSYNMETIRESFMWAYCALHGMFANHSTALVVKQHESMLQYLLSIEADEIAYRSWVREKYSSLVTDNDKALAMKLLPNFQLSKKTKPNSVSRDGNGNDDNDDVICLETEPLNTDRKRKQKKSKKKRKQKKSKQE